MTELPLLFDKTGSFKKQTAVVNVRRPGMAFWHHQLCNGSSADCASSTKAHGAYLAHGEEVAGGHRP